MKDQERQFHSDSRTIIATFHLFMSVIKKIELCSFVHRSFFVLRSQGHSYCVDEVCSVCI
jgi:hypothetical protein